MADVESFVERILSPRTGGVPWWKHLAGEERQGRRGRFLEETLKDELGEEVRDYRTHVRMSFFSKGSGSCMDGIFRDVGVEEKCMSLSFDHLIDGVISRGLVWTLGHGKPAALGLFVVEDGSAPMTKDVADAFLPVVHAVRSANVHMVFVRGETGEPWPGKLGDCDSVPEWLAPIGSPSSWELPPGATPVPDVAALPADQKLFGYKKVWARASNGAAYAECDNHWRMLDVGLVLRALGHAAAKVRYTGPEIMVAGQGVEARVRDAMRERFGVLLEWGVPGS